MVLFRALSGSVAIRGAHCPPRGISSGPYEIRSVLKSLVAHSARSSARGHGERADLFSPFSLDSVGGGEHSFVQLPSGKRQGGARADPRPAFAGGARKNFVRRRSADIRGKVYPVPWVFRRNQPRNVRGCASFAGHHPPSGCSRPPHAEGAISSSDRGRACGARYLDSGGRADEPFRPSIGKPEPARDSGASSAACAQNSARAWPCILQPGPADFPGEMCFLPWNFGRCKS